MYIDIRIYIYIYHVYGGTPLHVNMSVSLHIYIIIHTNFFYLIHGHNIPSNSSPQAGFPISVTHRLLFSFTCASSDLFVSRRALQLTPQCQMDSAALIGAGGCESDPWPSVSSATCAGKSSDA